MDEQPSEECLRQNIDPSESKSGYNRYYFYCESCGKQVTYASTLFLIDAVKESHAPNYNPKCCRAIKKGICPALAMQEREREAGKALFFVDHRERMKQLEADKNQSGEVVKYGKRNVTASWSKRPTQSVSSATTATPKPSPKSSSRVATPAIDERLLGRNLLGEAIEKMMESKHE